MVQKKKVTGRYQLQFPLVWVRNQLKGKSAEAWRAEIMKTFDASPKHLKDEWRRSFEACKQEMMNKTLTVEGRSGRRFDRSRYCLEAQHVYTRKLVPDDASPKLLAKCFQHSVDFLLAQGEDRSGLADHAAEDHNDEVGDVGGSVFQVSDPSSCGDSVVCSNSYDMFLPENQGTRLQAGAEHAFSAEHIFTAEHTAEHLLPTHKLALHEMADASTAIHCVSGVEALHDRSPNVSQGYHTDQFSDTFNYLEPDFTFNCHIEDSWGFDNIFEAPASDPGLNVCQDMAVSPPLLSEYENVMSELVLVQQQRDDALRQCKELQCKVERLKIERRALLGSEDLDGYQSGSQSPSQALSK